MLETFFLPLALAFIMLSVGLSLRPADFRSALSGRRALGFGLFGQLLLLPLLALLLGVLLELPATAWLGLMILAACPGGASSAFLTQLARGNVALSLLLTVSSSLLVLLTLPLIVNLFIGWQQLGGALAIGDLPLGKLLAGVLLVTTLPVLAGMWLRLRSGWLGERGERAVNRLATAFFAAIVVVTFVTYRDTIVRGLPTVGLAVLLLNLSTMAGGMLLGRLARLQRREAIAIALECGLQNAGLGIFVSLAVFQQAGLAVPSVVYALMMNVGALLFLAWARRTAVPGT